MRAKVSALDLEDEARLDQQRKLVHGAAGFRLGEAGFRGMEADLNVLQRMIDDGSAGATQFYLLQSMGVVYGDVIARAAGLKWVMVEDQTGRDPALRLGETDVIVHPLTMISKRVQNGQHMDVRAHFDSTVGSVKRIKHGAQGEAAKVIVGRGRPWWRVWG